MKPFTSKHMFGAGSSPLKQVKSKRDSKEVEAYKQELAAAKDKRVKQNQHKLDAENKKGYSKQRIDINKRIVARGTVSHGGATVNYRTGETKIADFPNKYVKGGTYDKIVNTKTGKLVTQAGASNSANDYNGPSNDYKNEKMRGYYNNESLRRAHIKDSIYDREDKEIRLQGLKNTKKIAMEHGGMQESEIGGGTKTPTKKPVKKPVKKLVKKSPLLQITEPKPTTRKSPEKSKSLPPGTKTDGDMSKLDKYGRTPDEQRLHKKRLDNMTPADHESIRKNSRPSASKKTTATAPGTAGTTGRRIPLKMKKC
jgi:hypothetical protein